MVAAEAESVTVFGHEVGLAGLAGALLDGVGAHMADSRELLHLELAGSAVVAVAGGGHMGAAHAVAEQVDDVLDLALVGAAIAAVVGLGDLHRCDAGQSSSDDEGEQGGGAAWGNAHVVVRPSE